MSDPNNDENRAELASVLDDTRRHLQWLLDAGVKSVKREAAEPSRAGPAASATKAAAGYDRPSFLQKNERPAAPPIPRPAPPPAPVLAAAPVATVTLPAFLPGEQDAALRAIRDELGDCRRCGLCQDRTKIVYGEGRSDAELLFVGEGPGEDEDLSGRPFVGRAGELLEKMINAMGFARSDVYLCTIVKCRLPGNRRPGSDEVEKCRPFVERQIRAIRPKVIVALGATAAQSLLRTDVSIPHLRNKWAAFEGIAVMPTFHPSYLLLAPQEKAKVWDDLKAVVARLGRELPARK